MYPGSGAYRGDEDWSGIPGRRRLEWHAGQEYKGKKLLNLRMVDIYDKKIS
jgi:hypothetical protein